jgi:hypothetical protein
MLGGCDTPPRAAHIGGGPKVKSIVVDPGRPEVQAVANYLQAETRYRDALAALHAYYERIGAYDKMIWSERETSNLNDTRTFQFVGAAEPAPAGEPAPESANEAGLVENVAASRQAWKRRTAELEDYYQQTGQNFKLAVVRTIAERYDPVRVYAYFLELEIPPATLRPTAVDPEAEKLFAEALRLHRAGKPLPGVTDYDKQRQALMMFLKLVREHPDSTRIAEAAYYIADIYKEYFNENVRAAHWYERAWQWDPNVPKPARFQAAVLYDLRLGQHGTALELYRQVVQHETFNVTNVWYAKKRIKQLTEEKQKQ